MSEIACRLHPRAPTEGSCAACSRAVCLACAVPVRGSVLCSTCAGRETDGPVESASPIRRRWRPVDVVAGSLFLAATLVSLLPWDRTGDLTSALSAWVPRSDPWPLFTGVLLATAAALALLPSGPRGRRLHTAVGLLGVLAAAVALPAPDFSARSVVPLVVLGLGAAGATAGLIGVRRTFS